MTRFAFFTWDGGGNTPPAVGIAQELALRGHEVVFFGYETQRQRFEAQGLAFNALRRSGSFDIYFTHEPAERIAGLMANVWACPEHLDDVPDAVADSSADLLIIDFMMQGILAAVPRLATPVAILAHSSIAGLIPAPDSPMGALRSTKSW
jgi:UDP:flavonoid glycosyltransferase YjiC (YdhE family)